MNKRLYSYNKSYNILIRTYKIYKKRWKKLGNTELKHVEKNLSLLNDALKRKDRVLANEIAKKIELFNKKYFRKTIFKHMREVVFSLAFALIVATVIRQVWLEHYEVPTGSMRPTLKELDHLIVSKTDFGINIPFIPKHLYFDPKLIKHTDIIVFTVENMDVPDQDAKYFYIFPSKKRFVKRLIGKPGDTFYFYGGKIYGIDKNGNEIRSLIDSPWMQNLEYIPFMTFEGKVENQSDISSLILYQMNQPIAKLYNNGKPSGDILYKNDQSESIEDYGDIWGIKNYGMTRLLTYEEVKKFSWANDELEKAPLYLEIRHSPSINKLHWQMDSQGRFRPSFMLNTTAIPLQERHLQALMDNMYTSRFFISNGKLARYHMNKPMLLPLPPSISNVANGCYEFYYGKAFKIGLGGLQFELPKDNPLYSLKNIQTLYNLGIECSGLFAPYDRNQPLFPARYAYFHNGDLYLLGKPILKKDDPTLINFIQKEEQRKNIATPFKDHGAPLLEDGSFDHNIIKKYGLKIYDNHYLALGDNHSSSADSRVFGFVPQNNLRGSPSLIIWPFGNRWGTTQQAHHKWITTSKIIVWGGLLLTISLNSILRKRKHKSFTFTKISNL